MLPLINRTSQSYGRSLMTVQELIDNVLKAGSPVAALTDIHSLSALPEFLLRCAQSGVHGVAGMTVLIKHNNKPFGEMVLLAKGGVGFASLRDLLDEIGHCGLDNKFNPERGLELNKVLSGAYASKFANCIMLDGYSGSLADAIIRHAGMPNSMESVKTLLGDANSNLSQLKAQFSDGDYLGVNTQIGRNPLAGVLSMPPVSDGDTARHIMEVQIGVAKDDAQLRQTMQWFKVYAKDYLASISEDSGRVNELIKSKFNGCALAEPVAPYVHSQPPFLGASYIISKCPTPKIFKYQPESKLLDGGEKLPPLSDIVFSKWDAFQKKLLPHDVPVYWARLIDELDVIKHCRFEDYFSNIYKIKLLAEKENNALMLRGSAVSSLVMHVLDMTPIDPIKESLLFARFMNKDRIEDPDVDIEFVDPIGMSRAIERDFSSGQIALLSSDSGISKALTLLTMGKDALLDFYAISEKQRELVQSSFDAIAAPLLNPKNSKKKWAGRLDDWLPGYWDPLPESNKSSIMKTIVGVAKNYSAPAFGNGLSPGSVVFIPEGVKRYFNLLPAYKDKVVEGGVPRIPQTKYNILSTGHIKYDLLSNRSFTRSMNAWESLKLPKDMILDTNDPTVAYVFSKGAFLGVNQVSGYVGADLAERFKPKNFNELTAVNALIRDGGSPSTKGMIDQYLYYKDHPESVVLDNLLVPIVGETHGSLLYEEQLMRMLTIVGGFSWQDADRFRSAIKKGKGGIIDEFEGLFIEQASKLHGVDANTASAWYQPLRDKRGRYVFNKAHAVAYAHVAVRQCWLKCHYPAQYAAELFVDDKVSFKGNKVNLNDVLLDWRKLHSTAAQSPQKAVDFIRAVGLVLLREEGRLDSKYRRNLSTIKGELEDSIKNGFLDFVAIDGQDRVALQQASDKVFQRLTERGYSPKTRENLLLKPVSVKGPTNTPATAPIRADGSVAPTKVEGSNIASEVALEVTSEIKPVNRRSGFIDWKNGVMIGHYVDFLFRAGIVKDLEVSLGKSSSKDHYRFHVLSKTGERIDYHVAATSTSPVRSQKHDHKYSISSGFFQGGSRDRTRTDTLTLAAEIASVTGMGDAPEFTMEQSGARTFISGETTKQVTSFVSKFVRQHSEPLYDVLSGGVLAKTITPEEPTSPVMTELFSGQISRGQEKMAKLFQQSRFISIEGLAPQINGGHISIAEVRTDKFFGNTRKKFLEVVANYRLVTQDTPLYNTPLISDNKLSPGGHQRFFFDAKKGRTGKMDLGFTTKRVKGHVCGHITPNSDTLWLGEAAMDTWSFNELQNEIKLLNEAKGLTLPYLEQNCVAVRSAGGATDVINSMLGVKLIDKPDGVDFCLVDKIASVQPFDALSMNSIKGWFLERTIHFLAENKPENLDARKKLRALMEATGMTDVEMQSCVKIHHYDTKKNFNQNVNQVYDVGVNSEGNSFLHHSNMDTWIRGSDLSVIENGADGYHAGIALHTEVNGPAYSTMSDEQKKEVSLALKEKFMFLSGAKSLGVALDNDGAGKTDAARVFRFCILIGLPVGSLMPADKKDVQLKINGQDVTVDLKDHSDFLMTIRKLQNDGQWDCADEILTSYANTIVKPKLDIPGVPMEPNSAKPLMQNI
jgi:hypothetical protein